MKRNALMVTLTIKVSKRGENTALMINYKEAITPIQVIAGLKASDGLP